MAGPDEPDSDGDVNEVPPSWMVQEDWLRILEENLKSSENWTWTAFMHLGVMLYEKGEEEKAIEAWENSMQNHPLFLRSGNRKWMAG